MGVRVGGGGMVTSRATYWKGSFLCGCRNNKPTSAGRMLRECWGARPGGSMWTSRWSSTIPACGAKCWSTSKTASRMVLDRAVLWAAAHEKKWSPSGSNLGAAGHVHLCRRREVGMTGRRSLRLSAVEKVALSRRKTLAVLGRCSAKLVRGERAEGMEERNSGGVAAIKAGTVCSTIFLKSF